MIASPNLGAQALENEKERTKPRWGQERRLAFIDLRLQYDGKINRKDIQGFFDISIPQASADLDLYKKQAGDNLTYDGSSRAYVAGPAFVPITGRSAATTYLDELYRLATGITALDETFVGYVPPTGVVATPVRDIRAAEVAALVRAIRDKKTLAIVYQSMSSDGPVERVISPHAMGFDGLRWHVRAWCHERKTFRDFAIGRLRICGVTPNLENVDPETDAGWATWVNIVLKPHPELSPSQCEAVMHDYAMEEGRHVLRCRKAMVFYTLRHLNLDAGTILDDPARQHVVLENWPEIVRWMEEDRELSP
jgi:hypothetical protein